MTPPVPYCADEARKHDETLYGTATQVETWLLLEYAGPWGAKATSDNTLPAAVQQALAATVTDVPGSRLLFIRQAQRADGPLRLFIARTGAASPALYRYALPAYEALLSLDLAALATRPAAAHRHEQPLWAVCTNGKRDRCCARYGTAFYHALTALRPGQVWQSSHIGGHRFAPTVLALPQGVCYGRIDPDKAAALVTAVERDALYLHGYRGRTAYPPAGQAAEFFLRVKMEDPRRHRFQLRDVTVGADGTARARFSDTERDVFHEVRIVETTSSEPVYVSCDQPGKKVPRYRFLGHSVAAIESGHE